MNRFVKTLLIWLIMIALPLQATASVIKASCGADHHAMMQQHLVSDRATSVPSHAHGHGTRTAHDEHGAVHPMQTGHASAQADFAEKASSATDDAATDKAVKHDSHSTCSACAACCVGAVAPPSAHVKTPHFTAFTTSSIVSSSFLAGFIPAGLERPPRSSFA